MFMDICKHILYLVHVYVHFIRMRQGPRSRPTPLTRAVVTILNKRMADSDTPTKHRLAGKLEGRISRSQLYKIMDGEAIADLAELEAICEALGIDERRVYYEAQVMVSTAQASEKANQAGRREKPA